MYILPYVMGLWTRIGSTAHCLDASACIRNVLIQCNKFIQALREVLILIRLLCDGIGGFFELDIKPKYFLSVGGAVHDVIRPEKRRGGVSSCRE